MQWDHYLSDPALGDFVALERPGVRALVRRGYEAQAGRLGLEGPPASERSVHGGREAHPLVVLAGGERVVVRGYRRGGLVRHLNRDRYFLGHRAFAELRATERARCAGVRVPELLAAVETLARVGYRALLAMRLIEGARESAGWLAAAPDDARRAMLREAGRQIARMHDAGVAHPDVNLRNLLVVGSDAPEVWVIDFDRAREYDGAVPAARRAQDLRRLARSARKLAAPIDAAGWSALREGYGTGWPVRLALLAPPGPP